MFHADIKEKKNVCNILKKRSTWWRDPPTLYNEAISRFVNLKKTFFPGSMFGTKTTHFLIAFHLKQDSSVDIIESRNLSVCCVEFIERTCKYCLYGFVDS